MIKSIIQKLIPIIWNKESERVYKKKVPQNVSYKFNITLKVKKYLKILFYIMITTFAYPNP